MADLNIEELIGKNISGISYGKVHLTSETESGSRTYIVMGFENLFFSKTYRTITISTNDNDTVQLISFSIEGVMDEVFFNELTEKYGNPQYLAKKGDTAIIEDKQTNDGEEITTTKGTLVACEFSDDPVLIKWDNPTVQMQFLLIKENNMTNAMIGKIPANK